MVSFTLTDYYCACNLCLWSGISLTVQSTCSRQTLRLRRFIPYKSLGRAATADTCDRFLYTPQRVASNVVSVLKQRQRDCKDCKTPMPSPNAKFSLATPPNVYHILHWRHLKLLTVTPNFFPGGTSKSSLATPHFFKIFVGDTPKNQKFHGNIPDFLATSQMFTGDIPIFSLTTPQIFNFFTGDIPNFH